TYAGSPHRMHVDLAAGTATGWGSDTLQQVEDVAGSSHEDVLEGDGHPNRLFGSAGNDVLLGRGGADSLSGGDGDDFLAGGAGAARLAGGPGGTTRGAGPGGGPRDRIRPHRRAEGSPGGTAQGPGHDPVRRSRVRLGARLLPMVRRDHLERAAVWRRVLRLGPRRRSRSRAAARRHGMRLSRSEI